MLKKSIVVGVSVTPEIGLEAAVVDFESQTLLKYGTKPIEYDIARREIADIDLFKDALMELLLELQIPKGAEIVLNIPTIVFKINDYPAALDEVQVSNAIEEELIEHPIFKTTEAAVGATKLPNSSIQFNKIAYTAAQKGMLIEIAMLIKTLGYKLLAIDTSVNSILNTLMYKQRVDINSDKNWLLLIVDNMCCRILTMNGRNYIDAIEEKISIGQVLEDAENYSTVINAVTPILKNIPARYLCVVSTTNIISAEQLASKLNYSAPIIHQEANSFAKEALLEIGPEVEEAYGTFVSMDVIGAAILRDFDRYSSAHFNLFNSSLGDIYLMEQPPEIYLGGKKYILTNAFLISLFIMIAIPIIALIVFAYIYYVTNINSANNKIEETNREIASISQYLKENENISTNLFDEGDEIRMGLEHNKNIYSYYTIVGTEIPKKLWLTGLKLGDKTTIEGQADNLQSIYAFFRSVKDYKPESDIKLQKLGLASKSRTIDLNSDGEGFDTDSILTSLNADFYEFVISDEVAGAAKPTGDNADNLNGLPSLEPINETN